MPLSSYLLIPISNNYSNNDFHTYNTSTLPLTSVFLTTLPLTTSSSNNIHPLSAPNPPPTQNEKPSESQKYPPLPGLTPIKANPSPPLQPITKPTSKWRWGWAPPPPPLLPLLLLSLVWLWRAGRVK